MRIAATLLLATLVSFSGLPGKKAPHGDELKIELRNLTERHSYSFKDFIVLDFVIINTGREPVGVFAKLGMGYQGGVILHVLDSEGAEIQPPSIEHDFLDFRRMRIPQNYFELQPGHFLGTRQKFGISEFVWKPGHYKLLAEYHCPVDPKYGKVGNFWSVERKSIVSSEIEFNVK